MDKIREAIQKWLNDEGEGWNLTQFVVAMGLERIQSDGAIESIAWYHAPESQADWQTAGLLDEAAALHKSSESEED